MMNQLTMKLRILLRAETTLFKAEAQRRANKTLLMFVAIGALFVAIVFVNMGVFYNLTEAQESARAAFILAAANFFIALIPYLISMQMKPGSEEAMVQEIREMTMNEISADVEHISNEFKQVGKSIKQVKSGFTSLSSGGGSLASYAPLVGMAVDLLKKKKSG